MTARRRRRRPVNDAQLSFDFEREVAVVLRVFATNVRRKGPKAVGRELGLAYVGPHWRKLQKSIPEKGNRR